MSAILSLVSTWAPIIISFISLVVSVVVSVKNYQLEKQDKKQSKELQQLQLQLGELQLQKEREEADAKKSSKVEARHVLVGIKNHRIRIANVGSTVVTNVTTTCNEGPYKFIQDKEPFERLEPGESFDQNVYFANSSPSKFIITTYWNDTNGIKRSRENIITW